MQLPRLGQNYDSGRLAAARRSGNGRDGHATIRPHGQRRRSPSAARGGKRAEGVARDVVGVQLDRDGAREADDAGVCGAVLRVEDPVVHTCARTQDVA